MISFESFLACYPQKSIRLLPDTLPPLYTQGRNNVVLYVGLVSGEGVCPDGVFMRYGGIPAEV